MDSKFLWGLNQSHDCCIITGLYVTIGLVGLSLQQENLLSFTPALPFVDSTLRKIQRVEKALLQIPLPPDADSTEPILQDAARLSTSQANHTMPD